MGLQLFKNLFNEQWYQPMSEFNISYALIGFFFFDETAVEATMLDRISSNVWPFSSWNYLIFGGLKFRY